MSASDNSIRLDSIDQAIADIAAGKPVVVIDDEDRENEGDLIFAAELATGTRGLHGALFLWIYLCTLIARRLQ